MIGFFSDNSPATLYILVLSIISFSDISGSIPIILLASIDLPEPGLPIKRILCPPAAEISIALFAKYCPFTSEKSKVLSSSFSIFIFSKGIFTPFSMKFTTSVIFLTTTISIPSIKLASFLFS